MNLLLCLVGMVAGLLGSEIHYIELEAFPRMRLMVTPRHVGFFVTDDKDRPLESRLYMKPSGQIKSENTYPYGKKFLCRDEEKENRVGLCLTDTGKDSIFKVVNHGDHHILTLDDGPKGGLRVIVVGSYDIDNDYFPLEVVESHKLFKDVKDKRKRAYVRVIKNNDGKEELVTNMPAPQVDINPKTAKSF